MLNLVPVRFYPVFSSPLNLRKGRYKNGTKYVYMTFPVFTRTDNLNGEIQVRSLMTYCNMLSCRLNMEMVRPYVALRLPAPACLVVSNYTLSSLTFSSYDKRAPSKTVSFRSTLNGLSVVNFVSQWKGRIYLTRWELMTLNRDFPSGKTTPPKNGATTMSIVDVRVSKIQNLER